MQDQTDSYLFTIKRGIMKKIMFVFGTRPEFIKIYPVIMEAKKAGNEVVVVNTGQHKQMVNALLEHFHLEVDYDLEIMEKCNGLIDILTMSLKGVDEVIKKETPDVVLVHGDTAATLAGSLGALYNQVELGHIEAGLRTFNKYSPFPEEMNRQMTGVMADYHFAPTETTKANLLREAKDEESIFVVGNSAIDMLNYTIKDDYTHEAFEWMPEKKLILMTAHRRENIEDLEEMFRAIDEIARKYNDEFKILYPIHMNPVIREKASRLLNAENIMIVDPLDTNDFHNIMKRTHLILTDSGGIQEEAPSLGVPVLVLRDTTERPEGIEAGTLKLVGTGYQQIVDAVDNLLQNDEEYNKMCGAKNPYGNGDTSEQIVKILNR